MLRANERSLGSLGGGGGGTFERSFRADQSPSASVPSQVKWLN